MRYSLERLTEDDKKVILSFKNKMGDVLRKVICEKTFNPSYVEKQFSNVEKLVEGSLYKKSKYNVNKITNNLNLRFDVLSAKEHYDEKINKLLKKAVDPDELYKLSKIPFVQSELKALEPILNIGNTAEYRFFISSSKEEIQRSLLEYSSAISSLAKDYFEGDKETYNNLRLLSELAGLFSISLNGKKGDNSYDA